jgi:hypothetical protein
MEKPKKEYWAMVGKETRSADAIFLLWAQSNFIR